MSKHLIRFCSFNSRFKLFNFSRRQKFSLVAINNFNRFNIRHVSTNSNFCSPSTSIPSTINMSAASTMEVEEVKTAIVDPPCRGKPKGVGMNWDLRLLTPKDIQEKLERIRVSLKNLYDQVAEAKQLTFQNIIQPMLSAEYLCSSSVDGESGEFLSFPKYVAINPELRDASLEAAKELDKIVLELDMRKDVFEKLVAYKESGVDKGTLSPEMSRWLERTIRDGRRNGLHLSQEDRDKITKIKNEINSLSSDFTKNVSEETTVVLCSKEELSGMTAGYLESLELDEESGKYKVSLKYPHYIPLMKKCSVPKTRQKMEKEFNSRGGQQNKEILEKIIRLRQEEAEMLGYKDHATYMLEVLMAKSPDTVSQFLTRLAPKLQPLWEKEKKVFLDMKKEECEKSGREFDGMLHMWEMSYYLTRVEEEMYSVDNEEIKKYFPLEVVTNGILSIYQELLGLEFKIMENAQKWHDEVQVYGVTDRASSALLGYFYLDMFPRDGKYGHACCVPFQSGYKNAITGKSSVTLAAMICNFTRPTSTAPSLLDKEEVKTYFHEFGHVMHCICSTVETVRFHGCSVERDFVEAPSQMLENWVFEKEPLQRLSSHYQTGEPLPDAIIEKLNLCRNANAGYTNLRQIVFALFDQRIHSSGELEKDVGEVYGNTLKEVMGLEPTAGTCFPASFSHVAGGYSARYYGYMWSEVFSMDMFNSVFKKQGIMSPEAGQRYRNAILKNGGSVDATRMLFDFLGRDPNENAFLESKGLTAD